jgi:hypothetical protein
MSFDASLRRVISLWTDEDGAGVILGLIHTPPDIEMFAHRWEELGRIDLEVDDVIDVTYYPVRLLWRAGEPSPSPVSVKRHDWKSEGF